MEIRNEWFLVQNEACIIKAARESLMYGRVVNPGTNTWDIFRKLLDSNWDVPKGALGSKLDIKISGALQSRPASIASSAFYIKIYYYYYALRKLKGFEKN